jgi:hypothetical protein
MNAGIAFAPVAIAHHHPNNVAITKTIMNRTTNVPDTLPIPIAAPTPAYDATPTHMYRKSDPLE